MLIPQSRRYVRLISLHGQRRALFVLGGITVGAAAVGLALAADQAQSAFDWLIRGHAWFALAITPAGFAASRWLTHRFFPAAGGSGIPQAIAARALEAPAARARLVSLRLAAGKIVLTLLGLLCGASVGREGPTVQVGASILFAAGRLSPRRQPGLILAGASAGVAAAFNTPLAGIVFGIEEMSRSFEARTSGTIIAAVIAAGLTAIALVGDYTYFGTSNAGLHGLTGWLAVPALGVAGGLAGGLFSRLLILFGHGLPGAVGRAIARHPIAFAAACGLGVALCGLASGGTTFGTGYAEARNLVGGAPGASLWFGLAKFVATVLSAISGIPGGIFAPSLAVGAGLGADASALLPSTAAGPLIILGMVAYFAGVVQAPITAFVIVTEMTADRALLVPAMLIALIATATSKLICPEGVYHALSHNFLRPCGPDRAGAASRP